MSQETPTTEEITSTGPELAAQLGVLANYLDGQKDACTEHADLVVAEVRTAFLNNGYITQLLNELGDQKYVVPASLSSTSAPTEQSIGSIYPKNLRRATAINLKAAEQKQDRRLVLERADQAPGEMSISYIATYTATLCRALVAHLQSADIQEGSIATISKFRDELVAAISRVDPNLAREPQVGDSCTVIATELLQSAQAPSREQGKLPSGSRDAIYRADFSGMTPGAGTWTRSGTVTVPWSSTLRDGFNVGSVTRGAVVSAAGSDFQVKALH